MKKIFVLALLTFICNLVDAQIIVKDIFSRTLNDYQVTLIDWKGYVYNPMIKLDLIPPSNVSFPLSVTVNAVGSNRLMLNKPSTLSSNGASKNVVFNNSSTPKTIYLEIAPDREGGFGEIENYTLQFQYNGTTQEIPIRVLDQDDDGEPLARVYFDYRYDDINHTFDKSGFKTAAEMAIKDIIYFFDYSSFDEISAGDEDFVLVGNDWQNPFTVYNEVAYNGFYIFMRAFDSPYSTATPSNNGKYLKQGGVQLPGPLHRSEALYFCYTQSASHFTSMDDDDWYLTDRFGPYTDVYTYVYHEMGHGLGYHGKWARYDPYVNNYTSYTDVIDYQGVAVPIDDYGHIPDEAQYADRLSGQGPDYNGKFPPARWMPSKLILLIMSKLAGWPLREIGPFLDYQIETDKLPETHVNETYNHTLTSNGGGVPIYEWKIVEGILPSGLTLNSFTGKISGTVIAEEGTYTFTVQLRDTDELSTAKQKQFSLIVTSSTTGIEYLKNDDDNNSHIKLYPNPSSNELVIETREPNGIINFDIADSAGRVVISGRVNSKTIIQTSNFSPGLYLVKTENDRTIEINKIIIK